MSPYEWLLRHHGLTVAYLTFACVLFLVVRVLAG
jgi:hypothetical protein